MTFSCIGCKWVRHLDEMNEHYSKYPVEATPEQRLAILITLREDIRLYEDVGAIFETLIFCTKNDTIEFIAQKDGMCLQREAK